MSKKLLNESTVRRFMGLANLAPLSESFLDNQVNEEEEITENEEVVEEALDNAEEIKDEVPVSANASEADVYDKYKKAFDMGNWSFNK